ncbi:MAG: hypothetical protein FJ096_19170, partial [Deltaproteobacteria bacterium]|nr:hypothetical protein [Deltaproteobacteria bacterium]
TDCPANKACYTYGCEDGQCAKSTFAAKGTACDYDGGDVCDGKGLCVKANCTDGVKDGDETDVDCGGKCAPCDNDKLCSLNNDCDSGYCAEKSVGDGSGGGSSGSGGSGGGSSGSGGSGGGSSGSGGSGGSASGAGGAGGSGPTMMVCQACTASPQCNNDKYCDTTNGKCAADKAQGDACTEDAMCPSGHCVDGVCCDKKCDTTCAACSAAKTGGTDGTCAPVENGEDPDNECTFALGSCGGDVCGGTAGNCKAAVPNVVCRPLAAGSDGACDVAEKCDGTSLMCPPDKFQPANTDCGPTPGPCSLSDKCNANGSCIDGPNVMEGLQGGCLMGQVCNAMQMCVPGLN